MTRRAPPSNQRVRTAGGELASGLRERDAEISALDDALAAAVEGRGVVIAVEGEAGIGKSELLRAALGLAERRSLATVRARASDMERGFGYGLVRELAGRLLGGAGKGEGAPPPEAARELPRLLDPAREDPAAELMVASGFHELVAHRAGEHPLLLGVDDLHWADLPSLRVLLYLARRIEGLPALLCATTRPPPAGDPSGPLLDALLAEARDAIIEPASLSAEACAAIVAEALGDRADPAFTAACHEATGGNPLLLRELIRALASEGIEPTAPNRDAIPRLGGSAVSRTVRLRLAHLPEEASALARAAAVLGDGLPIAQVAEIAGLDAESAFEAAAGLGQFEILVGGSRVQFVHPLIREAVRSELAAGETAALHAASAAMLAGRGAPRERVAEHLLHTSPSGSADTARILREAGRAANAAGDAPAAVELLARAVEEPPPEPERPRVLLELAAAERNTDAGAASAHAQAAIELIDDPEQRATAALQLAGLLPGIDPRRTIELLEPHLARLSDPETRARAQAVMLTAALLAPDLLPRAREFAASVRPALGAATPAARMGTSLLGYLDALENRPAVEIVARLEPVIGAPLDPPWLLGQLTLGMIALVAADSPAALQISDRWSALASASGYAGQTSAALMCRSHALLARGRLTEAIADARAGLEAAELYVGGAPVRWIAAALAEALIEVGELDDAERVVDRFAPTAAPEGTLDLHGLLGARARLAALRGDRAGGLQQTLELGRRCERAGLRNPALAPWRSHAALLLPASADGADRARRLAGEEVELARAWGAPRALGRALTALAIVAPAEQSIALHEEAAATLDGSVAGSEQARANLELGAALRRRGQRAAARKPLRRAAELAEACGATPLADRAREELIASGARPRRAALSGPDALTPQERRVATLAAEGLSNQRIAERLYITPRTVESHLSNAYRKLDISTRTQLPGTLP